jgi:hypothetical protein
LVKALVVKQVAGAAGAAGVKMVVQVAHLTQARSIPSRVDLLVKTAIAWHQAVVQYQGVKQPEVAPRTQQALLAASLLDIIHERLLALCIALINIRR